MTADNDFKGLVIDHDNPSEEALDSAAELKERYSLPLLTDAPESGLILIYDKLGLGLVDAGGQKKQQPVRAEFTSAEMLYRLRESTAKSEALVKSIGNKGNPWHVVDATPGLGRDAIVMAQFGCQVAMIERSPVVAALLHDGLIRLAKKDPDLAQKLTLIHANSVVTMENWDQQDALDFTPDAVYLDPMFPHRKKSALVKKEMQIFQRLLGNDPDADSLLFPARNLAKKRVVVKRPSNAPALANKEPTMVIKTKKHRFDVYINHQTGDKYD